MSEWWTVPLHPSINTDVPEGLLVLTFITSDSVAGPHILVFFPLLPKNFVPSTKEHCEAIECKRNLPAFRRNLLLPSSGQKHILLLFYPKYGRSRFHQNFGKFLPHYVAPHPSEFQISQKICWFTDSCLLLSSFGTVIVTMLWSANNLKRYMWTHWIMHEIQLLSAANFCTPSITKLTLSYKAPTVKLFPSNNLHFV
jgi:hypothetical protein